LEALSRFIRLFFGRGCELLANGPLYALRLDSLYHRPAGFGVLSLLCAGLGAPSSWGVAGAVGRPKIVFDVLDVSSAPVIGPVACFLRDLIGLLAVTDGRDCSFEERPFTSELIVRCARVA
jgi:hypothetical protein